MFKEVNCMEAGWCLLSSLDNATGLLVPFISNSSSIVNRSSNSASRSTIPAKLAHFSNTSTIEATLRSTELVDDKDKERKTDRKQESSLATVYSGNSHTLNSQTYLFVSHIICCPLEISPGSNTPSKLISCCVNEYSNLKLFAAKSGIRLTNNA